MGTVNRGKSLQALTCSEAPTGHSRWDLRLLADKIEIEFSALASGYFHRRIPTLEQLEPEVLTLIQEHNR